MSSAPRRAPVVDVAAGPEVRFRLGEQLMEAEPRQEVLAHVAPHGAAPSPGRGGAGWTPDQPPSHRDFIFPSATNSTVEQETRRSRCAKKLVVSIVHDYDTAHCGQTISVNTHHPSRLAPPLPRIKLYFDRNSGVQPLFFGHKSKTQKDKETRGSKCCSVSPYGRKGGKHRENREKNNFCLIKHPSWGGSK